MSIDLYQQSPPQDFNDRALRTSTPASPAEQEATRNGLAHILVATRLQSEEREAVILAMQMAASHGARLTVFHVVAPFAPPSVHVGDAIDNLHRALSGQSRDGRAAIEQGRADIAAFLDREIPKDILHSVDLLLDCRVGDVAQEIALYADHQAVDLLVLCDRTSGWRPQIFSSLSQRIERLSSKPLVFGRSRKARHGHDSYA